MKGEKEPSLLEFSCKSEYCGGIADRFLGMVSTFLYAILTKRAFSISWEQPAPFDTLFDSPHIDWSRPYSNTTKTLPQRMYRNETLLGRRKEINAHNWEEEKIDDFFPNFIANYSNNGNTSWLQVSRIRFFIDELECTEKCQPNMTSLNSIEEW